MNQKKRLYTVATIVVLSLSTSIGQGRRGYEVEAKVYSVPGSQSDASRAINAYERLMERHMDLTERTLTAISADMQAVWTRLDAIDELAAKLDAIDVGMAQLDARLARIERHLGIIPPPVSPRVDPNALSTGPVPADSFSPGVVLRGM